MIWTQKPKYFVHLGRQSSLVTPCITNYTRKGKLPNRLDFLIFDSFFDFYVSTGSLYRLSVGQTFLLHILQTLYICASNIECLFLELTFIFLYLSLSKGNQIKNRFFYEIEWNFWCDSMTKVLTHKSILIYVWIKTPFFAAAMSDDEWHIITALELAQMKSWTYAKLWKTLWIHSFRSFFNTFF